MTEAERRAMVGSWTGGACLITATISDSDSVGTACPPELLRGIPGPTTAGGGFLADAPWPYTPKVGGRKSEEPASDTTGELSDRGETDRLSRADREPTVDPAADPGLLPGRTESGGKADALPVTEGAGEPFPCGKAAGVCEKERAPSKAA